MRTSNDPHPGAAKKEYENVENRRGYDLEANEINLESKWRIYHVKVCPVVSSPSRILQLALRVSF